MRLAWLVLAFAVATSAGAEERPLLAADGKTDYIIEVSSDAIAAEQTAARELQENLRAVTGVSLAIVPAPAAGVKKIVVGPSASFKAAFPELDLAALKCDGIVMKTAGETLYLAGGRPRGSLYAVYTFLEDVVGCRWWSSTESFTPSKARLELPSLDVVYTPKLLYREAFYRDAFDGVFAARTKCNGHFDRIPEEYGGHYSLLGWCHTFNQLIPPEKYFQEHPEWYSEIGGKRVSEGAQLCLTNDAMRAELVKNALEWIRRDPASGIISIAQNDCGGNCQCARCAAVEQEEGAASGLIVRFVNSVAEEIEKEFPEVLVETLAYSYSRQAPKLARPRKNVLVRLCSIECCFNEPLATGAQNADFQRDMEAWSAIAPQLYIWDYVTNFRNYLLPHPNLHVFAPNIRFFVENKAIGVFEQGDAGSTCGEFPELRAWLLAHLMWDPSRDDSALIHEFMTGYYGAAAQPLEEYLKLTSDAAEKSGACLRCFLSDTSSWFGLDDISRATALFDEAQRLVAGDSALSKRVRRARLVLDHAWLNRYHALKRLAAAEGKPFAGPADPVAFCGDFVRTCNEFDAGSIGEGAPFGGYAQQLMSRFRAPAPAPDICAGLREQDWVDVQDNEFSLASEGVWAAIVDEPLASDEKAARMPANHGQWAVQYPVSGDVVFEGKARCHVYARCDAKASSANAFQLGIYDGKNGVSVSQQIVSIADSAGSEYRRFDLGVQSLNTEMYVWIAPMGNPDEVDGVFVDRILFVREK